MLENIPEPDSEPGQELQGQTLKLKAKEKLSGDVQAKKKLAYSPFSGKLLGVICGVGRAPQANHGSQRTIGFGKKEFEGPQGQRNGAHSRSFNTSSKSTGFIVDTKTPSLGLLLRGTYTKDKRADWKHMSLPAAGHHGKECPNATKCDDSGSLSTLPPDHVVDESQGYLHAAALPIQQEQLNLEPKTRHDTGMSTNVPAPIDNCAQDKHTKLDMLTMFH